MRTLRYTLVFTISTILCTQLHAQLYTVKVKHIQTFKHPIDLETNDAIAQNKIQYGDGGTTSTIYIFDLTKNAMSRKVDNDSTYTFKILESNKKGETINITTQFPQDTGFVDANYTISRTLDKKYIIECRFLKDGEIQGWFDRDAKVAVRKQ